MSSDPSYSSEDRRPEIVIINTIFIALMTVIVSLRFIARRTRNIGLAADDWIIFLAAILVWILYAISMLSTQHGLGRHASTLKDGEVNIFLELLYFYQLFYVLAPPTIKLSLLFFYRRIFVGRVFIPIVNILIVVCALWAIIVLFVAIFFCTPINSFWTGDGKCLGFNKFAVGYAVINIAIDLIVWVLPIPMIWKLQLPIGQKVSLTIIFILGLFDCSAAMARLITAMLVIGTSDPTWFYTPGFIWSVIEPSVGVMCACLPTLRVILEMIVPKSWRKAFSIPSGRPSRVQPGDETKWPRSATYNEIYKNQKIDRSGSKVESDEEALELNGGNTHDGITVSKGFIVERNS